MAEKKIIELEVKSNLNIAEKSLGTLKQQLKAAKAEVLALSDEFGITSQQAIKAAEKAAELGHEISAANKLVKTFNPSSTLNSTTQALGSVKEGFEVASHTMKTFGVESTELEGALGKVGVAMELTSGITSIQESAGAFNRLGATLKSYSIVQKIITAGQWLWNAALNANPIGAMVVAITALIAAGYALTKYFIDNANASHKNEQAIKENSKALNEQIKTANKNTEAIDINSKQKLAMAKASGKSSEEIRKLELKLVDEKIAFSNSSREIAKNTYYKNLNALATLKSADADEEQIKKQEETTKSALDEFSKQNKNLTEAVKEKLAITNRHQVEIRQSETDNNKKLRDLAKEAAEKAREELKAQKKKDLEDLKAALKAQKDATQTNINEVSDAISNAQDKQNEFLGTAQEAEEQKVKDKYFRLLELAKQQGRSQEEIDVLEIQRMNELNDIRVTSQKKQYEDEKVNAEAQKEIAKKLADAKIQNLQRGSSMLGQISDLVGKNTAAGKAAAVAAATIDTYGAAQSAFKNAQLNPISIIGPAYPYISAGLAIAGGLKNVKSILSVKTPGGGGGSAPSGGGMGSAPAAPAFNVVGASATNQLAQTIGNKEQQPVKAYVVSNDVTTAQSLDRNIIQSASIG